MSAACPDLPIVVLPENQRVRALTRPAAPVESALAETVEALLNLRAELLNPAGARGSLKDAADAAVKRTDRLAAVARLAPMDTASMVPIVPNHTYFGVRTAPVDDARLVSEVTTVLARALADLVEARLDLNDQAAEVLSMVQVLRGLAPADAPADAPQTTQEAGAEPPAPSAVGRDELTRWVITHHFYFVLNLAAADAVSRATAALKEQDREAARTALDEATVYVRGFTAAMMHSGDMSAPAYDAMVRPTMHPPAVPVALTGRTQPEHKAYRKAMRTLVKVSAESFAELAAADPELALARDALLEADLQDIERHIAVTAALVGDDRSLVQGEASESAIAVLRTMRHARAESYRPLMRFGDPVTLVTA
ncbi:hypothetical protein AB0I00_38315 [Streptomyces sp. NPDC050803]|uniref:hypothetical protein n=1 Tax=unclassified Streptomyces TaxID=2593676 RepID=UPI00341EAC41